MKKYKVQSRLQHLKWLGKPRVVCSYALLSYYTAYLRTHHKLEYMSSLLNSSKEKRDKFLNAMKTIKSEGIKILPPQINSLHEECMPVGDNAIRLGTNVCKSIKNAGKYAIEATRTYCESLFDFIGKVNRSKLNVRVCKAMVSAGMFDEYAFIGESKLNREGLRRLVEAYYNWYSINESKKLQWDKWNSRRKIREDQEKKKASGEDYGPRLIAVGKEPELPDIPDIKEFLEIADNELSTAMSEYEILGCNIGIMPTEYFTYSKELTSIKDALDQASADFDSKGKTYYFLGIINNFEEKRTRSQEQMANFLLEDESEIVPITIFAKNYQKIKEKRSKPENLDIVVAKVILKNVYDKYQDDYVISATLLDLDNPIKKLGTLKKFETLEDLAFSDISKLTQFLKLNHNFKGTISFGKIRGKIYNENTESQGSEIFT